jgi:hypothetical protein
MKRRSNWSQTVRSSITDIKAEYIWLKPEVGASGPIGGDDGAGGGPSASTSKAAPAVRFRNWALC